MIDWIADRMKERSTWLGLISFAAALGVSFDPAQTEAVVAAGMGLAGIVAAFTRG